jgi:transcription-repair coupling factor (superfamily II helicase)
LKESDFKHSAFILAVYFSVYFSAYFDVFSILRQTPNCMNNLDHSFPCALTASFAADLTLSSHISPPIATALKQLGHSKGQSLQACVGSADAWLLATHALHILASKQKVTLCVICANAPDVPRLTDELRYLLNESPLKDTVYALPDWETLPYDPFSPHQDLISERLATLHQLISGNIRILIVHATTSAHRFAPAQFMEQYTFSFAKGQVLNASKLRDQLVRAAYNHVSQVLTPGEYSIRGSIIDLFPMGALLPYRIDLFDDTIDSIRTFDPDTQRSVYPVPSVQLLPGREYPFDEGARAEFRKRYRELFTQDISKIRLYKDVGAGIAAAGLEYFLPLFFEKTATLFDYLPSHTQLITLGDVNASLNQFWVDIRERYNFLRADLERPILPPDQLFIATDDWFVACKNYPRLSMDGHNTDHPRVGHSLPPVAIDRKRAIPLALLAAYSDTFKGRIVLMAESRGRQESLAQLLSEQALNEWQSFESLSDFLNSDAQRGLLTGVLHAGFGLLDLQDAYGDPKPLAIITETELFALSPTRSHGKRKQEKGNTIEAMIKDLAELHIGDPVVHVQHGVARYQGLINLDLGDGETEFLHLAFAGEHALYVPVAQLHTISRYGGGNPDNAPLHSLGSQQWDKARRKAAAQARDTAAELLDLYARRALRQGHAFELDAKDYADFKDSFGFEETTDQAAAIQAVINDMVSTKPMDRLVCGDVGFGKTEVALRAAFIAVMGGKQVAILAPTTLLAEQHYETFKTRFAPWPVKIAELSRFRSTKEINVAVAGINSGDIDIVIGTHKLFSSGVKYPRLGLVIIDEEHRFGVRHKEALKALRAEVDILTLTATPIPRTLGMSLEGMRDLSVIATAPQRRLAIKTFVRRESQGVIREAVLRELKRGGQVYFLHNEVDTITNRKAALEEMLPEARIAIAHGQMPERDLERVMRDFYQQRFNVLLCTTIIETGIDVASANTIIMHRADKFGLAQLHQLRGRVGRSHHQAYAYLLIHSEDSLTPSAKQRLDAIQSMEELGSGFYLAMHDLEIRGAGEVLGEHQSGEVAEVGFRMYIDMINSAVKSLKSGKEPSLEDVMPQGSEVNLHAPTLLPADYVVDINQRLSLYKKLASSDTEESLLYIQEGLIDQYGKLPEAARTLMDTHKIRIRMLGLGITKIDAHADAFTLTIGNQTSLEMHQLIHLIQTNRAVKMQGQDKLRITAKSDDVVSRAQGVMAFLKLLNAMLLKT